MQLIYKEFFSHKDKIYVIAAFKTQSGIIIKIFVDGNVLHEFEASVSNEVLYNITQIYSYDSVLEDLIEQAREYIRNNF